MPLLPDEIWEARRGFDSTNPPPCAREVHHLRGAELKKKDTPLVETVPCGFPGGEKRG